MHNEFTAIFEKDGDWYIGYCPEIPGANGQGKTIEECKNNLAEAISLILEDRRQDALRGVPADARRETITISWIPRHTEIPNRLARKICKNLSILQISR